MEFQLSTEQFEELKKSILADLKEDRKNFRISRLTAIEHKYHNDLVDINGGDVWNTIRKASAYLIGRKLVKDVPVEERDELCDVAEELCQRIVEARKAKHDSL